MYLTESRNEQKSRTSDISMEVRATLDRFKERVATPSGIKNFFETCSDINVMIKDNVITDFEIINNNEHFMYHLGESGRHKIGFYDKNVIVIDEFEDEYFNLFLMMLSEAVSIYLQTLERG
jgi:hypothetical protein